MNGPHTVLTMETVLSERAREVRLAERLAQLRSDTPGAAAQHVRARAWLREFASRLVQPPDRPQCCPQIA